MVKAAVSIVIVGLLITALGPWGFPWPQEDRQESLRPSRSAALYSVLEKARIYASSYHRVCRDWVAEERMVQKELDNHGKVVKQRHFVSNYFFISLPSNLSDVVEVRETTAIDGRPVHPKGREGLQLLMQESSSATEEFERLAEESNRQNLGRKRHSNLVNIGLSFLMPGHQDDIAYELTVVAIEGAEYSKTAIIRFREQSDRTTLYAITPHGKDPLPSNGEIWLMLPQASVLKVDFSFRRPDEGSYSLAGRYVSEYQPGPDGSLLPAHFHEYLYDARSVGYTYPAGNNPARNKKAIGRPDTNEITFESEATYCNYRRFSAEVKILPTEPSSAAEESKPK